MDTERDVTDLGLAAVPDPDADPVDWREFRAPEPPPGPPATPAARRAVVEAAAQASGRRSSCGALSRPHADCGAPPAGWCRRAGREVVGYVHPSR